MDGADRTRREFLVASTGLGVSTLCAGCSSLNGSEPSTDLSESGGDSNALIPPISPSDYAEDEVTVTAFTPIVCTNTRETLRLRRRLLSKADTSVGPNPDHAGKVLIALEGAITVFEFVRESDRENLRKGGSAERYQGYRLLSEGPTELAVKDPRVILVTETEKLQAEPQPLLKRLIDFIEGNREGLGAERTDISDALDSASGKHVRRLQTRLSGDPLGESKNGATATALGASVEGRTEDPTISLGASAATPEGGSPPVTARGRLLEKNPLGLPFNEPIRSKSENVASATESVSGTPGLDENGEPILVDSDTVLEITAYQFGYEFHLPGVDVETEGEVEIPNNRPLGLRVRSADVIHTASIPELNENMMAKPEETHRGLVYRDELRRGEYGVFCQQLCGAGHSGMTAIVRVVGPAEFETWVSEQG